MGCAESRGRVVDKPGCLNGPAPERGRRRLGNRLRLSGKWSHQSQASCSAPGPAATTANSSSFSILKLPEIVVMNPEMSELMSSVANAATVCQDQSSNATEGSGTMTLNAGSLMRSLSKLSVAASSDGDGPKSPASADGESHIRNILRRFPFPSSGRTSPRSKIKIIKSVTWKRDHSINNNQPLRSCNANKASGPVCQQLDPVMLHAQHALNYMVMKSVETAVPVVVPLEKWLQDRLSTWVQLSGHDGMIVPASDSTLWKKRASNDSNEAATYIKLMDDVLCNFVAKFYREVEYRCDLFIEIEDLTRHFSCPAIMDIKIGTRTFLESEVRNPVKRHDLYKKMISIDPNEPTEEEHAEKAITKLRYMQFRERESSTAKFGFRIEAVKSQQGHTEKNFKRVKAVDQISQVLVDFLGHNNKKIRNIIVRRLKLMRSKMEQSDMFKTHEFIGSSLLLMYDNKNANVWMIDFAKVCPVEGMTLDHRSPWVLGNHEDGYLYGLDYLIQILEDCKFNGAPSRKATTASAVAVEKGKC